jgi:hypothetical protein
MNNLPRGRSVEFGQCKCGHGGRIRWRQLPRGSHRAAIDACWKVKPMKSRSGISEHTDDRSFALLQARNLKRARSAHAYVRGSTSKFYEWMENAGGHVAPEGPPIWICGDCHVGNLGAVANAANGRGTPGRPIRIHPRVATARS